MLRRMWSYRHLALSLAHREYKIRYRQSFIGLAWAVIGPLATLGVGTIIFKSIVGVDTGGTSYEVFTLAGILPWTFFASGLTFGIGSIVHAKSMVAKLSFPRLVIPISMVGTAFIDLAISSLIFVVFAYVLGEGLPLTALWVPLLLLIEIAFVLGLVLWGSAVNVFARDIRFAVPLVVQLWLLVTPVLYPLSEVPAEFRSWYLANPMAGLVESFRGVLIHGSGLDLGLLASPILGAGAALAIGTWYFAATQSRFADVI